jgi:hypothetical protein
MLATIDETFTEIEPIFAQVAETLGAHPQTHVESVLVLPNEDALDVYTRLATNSPLQGIIAFTITLFHFLKFV